MSSHIELTIDTTAGDILCVLSVDGDPNFSIPYTKDITIGQLKKAIHQQCIDDLSHIRADKLKLYLIHSVDPSELDDIEGTSTVPDNHISMKASRKKLGEYIENRDRNTVYVFVEFTPPPQPVAQVAANEEVEALKKKLEAITQDHIFDLIVEPKRTKLLPWRVNINTATLGQLKEKITKNYYPLHNSEELTLTLKSIKGPSPTSDEELRAVVRDLILAKNKSITVLVKTPSKPFSDYNLPELFTTYDLGDSSTASLEAFPTYICGQGTLHNNQLHEDLMKTLNQFLTNIPLSLKCKEATRSLYVCMFLNAVVSDFLLRSESDASEPKFTIAPEKNIQGFYGKGPVDYAIELYNGVTVGVTEVKRQDFDQGVAQNAVQIEAILSGPRKRKADDIEDTPIRRSFGIITDAEKWVFMECTRDTNGKVQFKLSKEFTVTYGKNTIKDDVLAVMGVIRWLFQEALSSGTSPCLIHYKRL